MTRACLCGLLALVAVSGAVFSPWRAINVQYSTVYRQESEGYHTFRIPGIARATDGTLVAFTEGRVPLDRGPYGNPLACYGQLASTKDGDCVDKDIVYKTSADGGHSWSGLTVVAKCNSTTFYYNPNLVLDRHTSTLWLSYYVCQGHKPHRECFPVIFSSSDHGRSFQFVKGFPVQSQPAWFVGGLGGGLQLTSTKYAGRLLFPDDGRGCVYSDDNGASWQVGSPIPKYGDFLDNQVVELNNGSLLMIVRRGRGGDGPLRLNYPYASRSDDGGVTWTTAWPMKNVVNDDCQVSVVALANVSDVRVLVMSRPNTVGLKAPDGRQNLTLSVSCDNAVIWQDLVNITPAPAAYSALQVLGPSQVGCLYEEGQYGVVPINFASVRYAAISLS